MVRPHLDATDFIREIKSIDYRNLIYQMGVAVMHRIVDKKPEEYRQCFRELFDETRSLKDRTSKFISGTLVLYRQTGEEVLPHHHDERTCATLLTYFNPDKYALYKNSFYQKYCRLINEKTRKKGDKYIHYLELIDELINNYIIDDKELLGLVGDCLPQDVYRDPAHKLLAQDILYQVLDLPDTKSRKYWRVGSSDAEGNYWDVMKDNDYVSIGWSDIGDLSEVDVSGRKNIEGLLREKGYYKENNSLLSRKSGEIFDFYSTIQNGDVVVVQDGATVLGIGVVTDEYGYNEEQVFSHTRPVNWKVLNPQNFTSEEGKLTTVFQIKDASTIAKIESLMKPSDPPVISSALSKNIILYGPPGTGKTYSTIDWAVRLADGASLEEHDNNKKRFDELRKNGQVEFITFHQNYAYEDFMVGITPDVSAGQLRFDRKEGIFKQLCDRARKNWMAAAHTGQLLVAFDDVFNAYFSKLIKEELKEVEIPMKSSGYTFRITAIDADEGRIKFTKQSGGKGHDLLIKNARGIYEGTLNYTE